MEVEDVEVADLGGRSVSVIELAWVG